MLFRNLSTVNSFRIHICIDDKSDLQQQTISACMFAGAVVYSCIGTTQCIYIVCILCVYYALTSTVEPL